MCDDTLDLMKHFSNLKVRHVLIFMSLFYTLKEEIKLDMSGALRASQVWLWM